MVKSGNKSNKYDKYDIDENGDEIYRIAPGRGEVYMITSDRNKIYANRGGHPYYARNNNNQEYYAVIGNVPTVITDKDNNPIYPTDENGDGYYYTQNNREIGFRNKDSEFVYCKDHYGNEIYPKVDGIESPIDNKYATKFNKVPYYPKDKDGNEYILLDSEKKPFYIIVPNNNYITLSNNKNKLLYPTSNLKRPIYPKDEHQNEYYEVYENKFQIGTNGYDFNDENYEEYYAKKANNDEFYPTDGKTANIETATQRVRFKDYDDYYMIEKYAIDSKGYIIYPRNHRDDEYYLEIDNNFLLEQYQVKKYAKLKNGKEIYPIQKIDVNDVFFKYEFYLLNRYAKDENDKEYYALDAHENEYLLQSLINEKASVFMPIGYPITNDNKIIVPRKANDSPYMLLNDSSIEIKHLKFLLHRKGLYDNDFLTDIHSKRISRGKQKEYDYTLIEKTKNQNNSTKNKKLSFSIFKNLYLYILAISVLVILWIIWFFGIRKTTAIPFK